MSKDRFFLNSVFKILVAECGAHESMRNDFLFAHERENPCDEYRFQGGLGFGGKYWRKENRVSCYSEDETPARKEMIKKANEALSKI